MELTEEMLKELQQGLKNARSVEDLLGKDGAIKKLLKSSIEQMLEKVRWMSILDTRSTPGQQTARTTAVMDILRKS